MIEHHNSDALSNTPKYIPAILIGCTRIPIGRILARETCMLGEEQQSVDEEKRLGPLTLKFDTATCFFL